MCDSYFYQPYLTPLCWVHSIYKLLYMSSSLLSYLQWQFLHLFSSFSSVVWPLSCHPSSIFSITFALCVSAHFRATHFMRETVVPIVRDTLTWWGDSGRAWCWLLPPLSSPCLSTITPHKGYTNIKVNNSLSEHDVLTFYKHNCPKLCLSFLNSTFTLKGILNVLVNRI